MTLLIALLFLSAGLVISINGLRGRYKKLAYNLAMAAITVGLVVSSVILLHRIGIL